VNSSLERKTVLVTGGTTGIGRAICSTLQAAGYEVFGTGRNTESGARLDGYTLVRLDVRDPDSVTAAVDYVTKETGGIDVLVNNAGIGMAGSVEDSHIEEIAEVFDVNVYGMVRMCQAVLPQMRSRGDGIIINISSVGALMGLPYRGVYSASKAAVESISESLSQEAMRFGVRLVLIEPGDFRTNINAHRKVSSRAHASAYGEEFGRIYRLIEEEVVTGADPRIIGKLVDRIIRTRHPRLRYNVGNFTSKAAVLLKFILPDRLFESLMMMHYRMQRKPKTVDTPLPLPLKGTPGAD
jgi:NAD(P)-dependent dehydrogenase (short-subunit alcohol dehydrogenase family)